MTEESKNNSLTFVKNENINLKDNEVDELIKKLPQENLRQIATEILVNGKKSVKIKGIINNEQMHKICNILHPLGIKANFGNYPRHQSKKTKNTIKENTSGRKCAPSELPDEAKKLCWGGFWLGFIWAICNNCWAMALFSILLPPVMAFVLLFKGNQWAWENKRWDNIAQFEKSQKLWGIWGFAIQATILVLTISICGLGLFTYNTKLAPQLKKEILPDEPVEKAVELVSMKPFVVELADSKAKRYIKIKMSLEVKDNAARKRIIKLEPELQNIVIMMLTSLSFKEVMTLEGKLRIRGELLERINQVTRPDKVINIYFTEFVLQ